LNTEKAFRASRNYLYNLTNSIADAVVSVRIPGRTIEWANDAIKTLGYKHYEIIGRTTEFIYARYDDFIAMGRKIEASIDAGKGDIVTEMMLKKKNGDIFPAEITISFFEENGEIVSATAIIRDTSERRERERQIEAYQQRLKSLAAKLALSEENERRRMAISLHDHVGQTLTIARLQLAAAQQATGDDALKRRLEETSRTLLEAAQETRHLIFDLSIPAIRELGLQAAIKDWIDEKMPQHGIKAELIDNTTDPNAVALKDNAAALLFRHTKELLINVIKHAGADTVTVKVTIDPTEISIGIHDNGIGFDARGFYDSMSLADNFGLFSIHEGMMEMGGALQIESEPGRGCRAMLRLPLKESATPNAQPVIPRIADSEFPFQVGR
jgi:PAS domain S-box-containing protein